MKSLNEDLKTGQLNNVYLLYGEEAYLKKQYKDKLRNAMVSPDDNMNYAYYEGKGININEKLKILRLNLLILSILFFNSYIF